MLTGCGVSRGLGARAALRDTRHGIQVNGGPAAIRIADKSR